ncbi:hypothetical protein L2Y96_06545 [Luteibacter aegosomaticola]|uniref:hypothetical protein n=1 Tax=Luteibacter aegosomaticola TaxID=2911538 RepID=UPI001FF96B50|nr:hypothetical protein [Luteibacter aegosomaticola]UPG91426.1 hypothetical protein L2Y96_06545 [Luteibacter aegosomaticola]
MTNASRKFMLAVLAALPLAAFAQATTKPAPAPKPAPRPHVYTPVASPAQQWQRQADQQQLINRQNQHAVQEQLRQNNLNQQRNAATDPNLRNQLDNADQQQQQQYCARQDNAVRQYQDKQATQPANAASRPL